MSPRLPSLALAALLSLPALAGTLSGVTLPDTAKVGGQTLVLNGMGLREKYFMDIYVGGLYLPAKTHDAKAAINDDVPKRIVMHFTYALSKEKLAEVMKESLHGSGDPTAEKQADTLAGWMDAVAPGDELTLDYVPGTGTSVKVKGALKGTLPGPEIMRALWGVYLGPKPPTEALKQGLLGM